MSDKPKEALIEEGKTRLYHGGVGPIEESRWFTSSRAYAEQYAAKSEGAALFYVDIPTDHPLIEPEWPDQNIAHGFTWSGELPEELARQAKPFTTERELTPEKTEYDRLLDEAAEQAKYRRQERDRGMDR
jgi:hypothetical protein